jgi:hypothetical protein
MDDRAMDDEEYARELFEILTRTADPDLAPHRLGPDWIDRSGGFGTDLRVTSIDVVPGEHGSQIDVGFALDLPAEFDLPEAASLLLPFDQEWREISGFDHPEDYAPRVAMLLMRNIYKLQPRRPSAVARPPREEQHALLLRVLRRHGDVEQQAPDRYVVTGGGKTLTVLLTADQWEAVLRDEGLPHDAIDHYEELLASRGRGERSSSSGRAAS